MLINGHKVLAYMPYTSQDGEQVGILIAEFKGNPPYPFVTSEYKMGDGEWYSGHYFETLGEAKDDAFKRLLGRFH